MASIYKKLGPNDVSNIRSVLNESVPVNGELLWSVYPDISSYPNNTNVQNVVTHMFQQVYDAPVSYSSANKIMDITLAVEETSSIFSGGYVPARDAEGVSRRSVYKSLSMRHLGVGQDGSTILFDKDGDFYSTTTDKYKELIVIALSRLMYKDEIKKGSFSLKLALHPSGYDPALATPTLPTDDYAWDGTTETSSILEITDVGAEQSFRTNTVSGDYAVLYAKQPQNSPILENVLPGGTIPVGLIFYQTGVIFLTPYLFMFYDGSSGPGLLNKDGITSFNMLYDSSGNYTTPTQPASYYDITDLLIGYDISGTDNNLKITTFADALRQRIYSLQLQNTIELNSTVYFCRINHNEFNYSSNPTYLNGSRIRVKNSSYDAPVSYITGVGLYSDNGELLAVAKLSEPLRKSTDVDLTLRVRLDF